MKMKILAILTVITFILIFFVSCSDDGKSGKNSLTLITAEDPGENCANDGVKVETGLDINSNGILD